MRIRSKIMLGFLTVSSLVFVSSYYGYQGILDAEKSSQNIIQKTIPSIEALEEVRFAGLRIVSSTSEYLLVMAEKNQGEPSEVDAEENDESESAQRQEETEDDLIQSGAELYDAAIEKYRHLIQHYADDPRFLDAIQLAANRLKEQSEALIEAKQKGARGFEILELKEDFEEGEYEFLDAIDAALLHEKQNLAEGYQRAQATVAAEIDALIKISLATFAVALLLSVLIAHFLADPLRRIKSAALAIGKGRFDVRVVTSSHDEVGVLAATINQMALNLKQLTLELEQRNQDLKQENAQRRAIAETLQRYKDSLEEQVKERTQELLQEKVKAEQASQTKTKFLARINHEIRTPLNVILGFARRQTRLLTDSTSEELKVTNTYILQSAQQLATLIEDMLEFVRLEQDKQSIEQEVVELDGTIRDSLAVVQEMADTYHITLYYDSALHNIKANRVKLRQALVNLLINAIKFNRPGGSVRVNVETEQAGNVAIHILDTGVGIDPMQFDSIFEPFTRLDYANQNEIPGSGIGLALTKFLVTHMGGEISVASGSEGSDFCLRFIACRNDEKKVQAG